MENTIQTDKLKTIALAGNPNAGKTTLFNLLTGLKQKVANYPGVTVERKTGKWNLDGKDTSLIDLPGLYSLDATSIDEEIALKVLKGEISGGEKPDVVIAIVDATNLERNLYLVTQILDLQLPTVVALTMIDTFETEGHEIDLKKFSALLGVPVVAVNAKAKRGIDDLSETVAKVIADGQKPEISVNHSEAGNEIFSRYKWISDVVQGSVKHNDRDAHRFSDAIDKVLTHRVFGLAFLLLLLLGIFHVIFTWAALPMDLLDAGFGSLADLAKEQMGEGMLTDLVADGIIAGVGGILVFLPQILLLFLFISILEDTGYMARAAFLMDRLMSGVGLHGKAFLPLISSFACAIPGVMATRTIEDRRDRFATIMIAPFMSCSARLPVYTLMISAFFAGQVVFGFISAGAVIMLSMYLLGIVAAVVVAFILKRTLLIAPAPPLIMEMPPYRVPSVRTVLQNMFERGWLFVKRAGTVILAISIILWALAYFPRSSAEDVNAPQVAAEQTAEGGETVAQGEQLRNSYAGRLGHLIEPVIQPLGFDWKIGVALIASFAAREVLVSTLSIIYNTGAEETEESETLISAIHNETNEAGEKVWTPLTAVTLMVFFVLAMQCMSTIAVVRRETNSWKWTGFMVAYMTVLAYVAAFVTYQGGKFLGF